VVCIRSIIKILTILIGCKALEFIHEVCTDTLSLHSRVKDIVHPGIHDTASVESRRILKLGGFKIEPFEDHQWRGLEQTIGSGILQLGEFGSRFELVRSIICLGSPISHADHSDSKPSSHAALGQARGTGFLAQQPSFGHSLFTCDFYKKPWRNSLQDT